MYTGHFGIALAGKGIDSRMPLWILITAAFAPDLVISLSQLLGGIDKKAIEPIISSVVGGFGLALVVSIIYFVWKYDFAGSILLGLVSFLHTIADLITGRSHLWPGGPETGLHLYQYGYVDFALESSLVVAGWLLYQRSLPKETQRIWAAWAILGFLILLQLYFEIRP